jgi:SAM-dependent methyltransferase
MTYGDHIYCARRHWDGEYSQDVRMPWELDHPPPELMTLLRSLAPESAILDIGCGRGGQAVWIAGHYLTGIDVSRVAVMAARDQTGASGSGKLAFAVADATSLPFREAPIFDAVYDYSVLHHLSPAARSSYVKQLSQIVRSEGTVLAVCYSDEDRRASSTVPRIGQLRNPIYHLSADDLKRLYVEHFESVEISPARLGPAQQHPAYAVECRRSRPQTHQGSRVARR